MVKCLSCGWTGFSEDVIQKRVYAGEYQGHSAFETQRFCPECKNDELSGEENDDE